MSLVEHIHNLRRSTPPRPPGLPGWPATVRRTPAGALLVDGEEVTEDQYRARDELAVEGGRVLLARVVSVRHDPAGSIVTVPGPRPPHIPLRADVAVAGRPSVDRGQPMRLRWTGQPETTTCSLPVDVAQGDLLAVWLPPRLAALPRPRQPASP